MLHESNVARMLRDDTAEARRQWLSETPDEPEVAARREQRDFLRPENHDGEQ